MKSIEKNRLLINIIYNLTKVLKFYIIVIIFTFIPYQPHPINFHSMKKEYKKYYAQMKEEYSHNITSKKNNQRKTSPL